MKNLYKGIAVASMLTASTLAIAQGFTFGGGYANYMEDDEGIDVSVGAAYASIGYIYESGNVQFMPELRVGTGVSDDTVLGVNVEIDSLIVTSIRGQYNVTDSFGVFLQPSYGRLEATASFQNESFTDDEWEFGFGGGASFQLSESVSIEALYEAFDGADVLSAGIRMEF